MKLIKKKEFLNGYVGSVQLENGRLIETTATCLPFSTEMRGTNNTNNRAVDWNSKKDFWKEKLMVGISTQSGCPVKCKFCAVNKITERNGFRNLTTNEIFDQVGFSLNEVKKDPNDAKLFRILLTRMGEPCYNVQNVCDAIYLLKREYPNARIQVSTVGIKNKIEFFIHELLKLEEHFKLDNWLELQFSIHSTDNDYRKWLQCDFVLSNEEISELIKVYYNERPRDWKVTLNFSLSETTPFDVKKLREQFNSEHVFIKISDINENIVSNENALTSLIKDKNLI